MKSLAKFFLRLSLVLLPCLMAGCTSEVETIGGIPEKPENPQANDPNRRSVVISLQNKLILVNGTPESRATTRDGIAEEDENRIGSLDIYAFGSDKEEGPYTFQERFAYRAEAGTPPAGASPLELKADETAGKVNAVFYPHKGLFTKFYCVANQPAIHDAAGYAYTDYRPLQQSSQHRAGTLGDVITALGTPTEKDFVKLNTPLLESTEFNTGILLTPLPIFGANSQPVDLREYGMGTYVRTNVSLTRAVARFDVVNDASKSHFTITDIAMGNGRQGVTLFPIRPLGDIPATPGQLVMYPYRPFDGLNANSGITTKAFYCYPGNVPDEGFLILKGLYAVNQTDEKKEVTYRIPFERVTDGSGARIEISHNHRYTVQITEADPFELTADIRLVDWETGDAVEEYEPDNGLDAIVIADLLPAAESTYDVNTFTVTLALKAGSGFTATTGSNAGVEAILTYYNGTPADNWLKVEEIPVDAARTGASQKAKFKVSINESYTGNSYPRAILRLIDKAGGGEDMILVNTTYGSPVVESTGGTMNPAGANNWDATEQNLYMVQASAANTSTAVIAVTAIGGSKIELPADAGITVSPDSSMHATQEYTFSWVGSDDTGLAKKEFDVTLKNLSDQTKIGNIRVILIPNQISNIQLTNAGAGISLSETTPTTATLTMPIIKDWQFTLTMDSYSTTVTKCPAWLEDITPAASTRGIPECKPSSFTFKLKEDAANFDDTQLVFNNTITVDITREFQKPTITFVSSDPVINSYSSGTLNLYQLKSSYYSTATLKVYSLGGSKLQLPTGVEADLTQSDTKEQNYTIKYKTNYLSENDVSGGTLYAKNLSDDTKSQDIPVKFKSSVPTVSSVSGISLSRSTTDVDATVNASLDTGGQTGFAFTFTSPAGLQFSRITESNASNLTQISTGNQSGSAGSIKNVFTLSFKSTATFDNNPNLYYYAFTSKDARFPDYQIDLFMGIPVVLGKTAFNLNGLWVMPYYSGTINDVSAIMDKLEHKWRTPGSQDCIKMFKWSSFSGGNLNTDMNYLNRIFKIGGSHWLSMSLGGGYYQTLMVNPNGYGTLTPQYSYSSAYYVLVHN